MSRYVKIFCLLSLVVCLGAAMMEREISDLTLLLPVNTCEHCDNVSYNITAYNGCYQWEISHPHLIGIKPIYDNDGCSNTVVATSKTSREDSSLIWITAKDKTTGDILKCEAKVGKISTLQILTKMRTIDVDDINILEVQAFDQEGNVFSTVEGLKFQWRIESNPRSLRIIPIKEANFKTTQKKLEMEKKKEMSDISLFKGVQTGVSEVSVQIIEENYGNVAKASIILSVIEPFILDPTYPVYILPNSKFEFGILKARSDRNHQRVSLPSDEYSFESQDTAKGVIFGDGVFNSFDRLGPVTITAQDTAIKSNQAQGLVHIVPPESLEVDLYDITERVKQAGLNEYAEIIYSREGPQEVKKIKEANLLVDIHDETWTLVEERYYLANLYLFDQSKHRVELTKNLLFDFEVKPEFLEIYKFDQDASRNTGTSNYYIVKTLKIVRKTPSIGKLAKVETESEEVYDFDYSRLVTNRGIQITSQVKIVHPTPEIRLPYLGYYKQSNKAIEKQLWQLPAVGGTGTYKWFSNDENVSLVKKSKFDKKLGEVRGNNLGATYIRVEDSLNPFNYDTIKVYVTKIGSLSWFEERLETPKGGAQDYTHLIAFDDTGHKYTNCSSLIYSLSLRKEDSDILRIQTGSLTWSEIKEYTQQNLELIKLKNRFDENHHIVYSKDLPSGQEFDEELQLHNNFGICGSDRYMTNEEGLGRIKAYLPINYDTVKYSSNVETEFVQIASYKAPETISPVYTDIFKDLKHPNEQLQQINLLKGYYSEDVFKITYGSSLIWIYNGGTNYWADDIYSVEYSVANDQSDLGVKLLSENLPPLANRISYRFECENRNTLNLKHYEVSVEMKNKQTRSLLRPQNNSIKMSVHCAVPKSVDLWWAQKDKLNNGKLEKFPQLVVEKDENAYYLRNDQAKHMRALVFDQDKQIIFNTSSLVIDFSADLPEKLEFEKLKRNDKALARFKKESGYVYARVKINKDIQGNYIQEISDKKRIKLIERVRINPPFQTRYLHPDNIAEFYIVDGSGNVRPNTNTTELATMNHLNDLQTIEMSPRKEGGVEISIEDLGVESVEVATAELLISDIYRIELIGGGLIEQGGSMNLTIEVYDSQNKKFDKDQLKYMDIKAEIEKIGSSRREGLDVTRINDDTFNVVGLHSGNYRVLVVSCKKNQSNERVPSNYVRIEVFEVVKLVPSSILLFPGARWTIQVEGGPSGGSKGSVYREYEVEDEHICEIDEYGEVHAKHIGETWLKLNMFYKSNNQRNLLASRKIQIRVAFVTSIEIPMMNERSIFVDSLTRLNVKLKHEKETFLHAIGPLSFAWETSTPHVYDLVLPSRKDARGGASSENLVQAKRDLWSAEKNSLEEFHTNFNYSSIVGIANKHGDARITVKMIIEYPEVYKDQKNSLSHYINIKVTDKLTMQVPEFIEHPTKEPHTYILPPLARNKIVTNKDAVVKLAYSVQTGTHFERGYECDSTGDEVILTRGREVENDDIRENPILKIHKDGYVETLDKYGKATVVIEENQSLENQIVMLNIMISQIYSLSIEKPYAALNLPMGSETGLKITLQEENARSFANMIIGVDLFIENSHPHVVKATLDRYNSTLHLNALGVGEANIKVHTRDNIFDVIRVKVLSSVLPHSPVQLHVGGTVQFVFSEKESSPKSKWSTPDTKILSVDPVYGKAEGLSEGEGRVYYQGNVDLTSIVQVKKVERIEIDPSAKPEFFTNARSNSHYKDEHVLLLNVYLEDGLTEILPETIINGKPLIKSNVKISCETEDTNFAVVFAKTVNNRYACILKPVPDSTPTGSIPNTIKIGVSATSQHSTSYRTEEKFEIPFVSFFKVNHPAKSLNFYADERFKSIDVISNTDFNVNVEGNSDLINYKIQEKDIRNHYEVQFSIPTSVVQEFKDLKVRISNSLADSSETFYLSYFKGVKSGYSTGYVETPRETAPPSQYRPDEPYVARNSAEDSQLVTMIIVILVVFGIMIGLIYYCCSSVNTGYVNDSSYLSSDSKNRRLSSTPNDRKNKSLRASHSKYHFRN